MNKRKSNKGCAPKTGRNTRNPKEAKVNSKEMTGNYENDFSWYNHNPALLESACRIPFAKPTGEGINAVSVYDGTSLKVDVSKTRQPGVFVIKYDPSIGYSNSSDSPATIAAREIYARVRKAYSGTLVCDAPDFMMYMLSLDSIFSYIAYLKRIYRTVNVFSGVNKYVPDALLKAMHLSDTAIADIRANRTKFWGEINTLIANVSKFTCPAVMDIFNRHYWMNDSIFADRANLKGQFYMFLQDHYWQFDLDTEKRGKVKSVQPARPAGVADLIAFGNQLLSALNDDEDAYTINGYLMRSFEGVPNFKVMPLEESETMQAIFSPEVLQQIHNCKVTYAGHSFPIEVTQDGLTSIVYSKQEYTPTAGNNIYLYDYLMDSPVELPSGPEVVIASRLMPAYIIEDGKVKCYSGTEIPISFIIYTYASDGTVEETYVYGTAANVNNTETVSAMLYEVFKAYVQWSNFNLAPIYALPVVNQSGAIQETLFLGETTNLTSVDPETMKDLNRMCIYSEFNAFGINS